MARKKLAPIAGSEMGGMVPKPISKTRKNRKMKAFAKIGKKKNIPQF